MISIMNDQISCMLEQQRRRFVEDALPAVYHEFPELRARLSDDQVRNFLLEQCELAKRYGLMSAEGIYTLTGMRLRLGRDFPEGERFGWARALLARSSVPEAERVRALEAGMWGGEKD